MTSAAPEDGTTADGRLSADDLLAWYERHARDLPWRIGPADRARGARPDPYRIWISEIMLQQTTVKAVAPYFARFIGRWPSVEALAAASDDDVMAAWAGLGYYRRARNMLACARLVAEEHEGRFPRTATELKRLPGIGDYTAAAISAIAFGEAVAVIDGNVERVVSRLFTLSKPLPKVRPEIRRRLEALVPSDRPGEFAEALMDLGATVCTPKRPACILCPWRPGCAAAAADTADSFPVKPPRPSRPEKWGHAFVAVRTDGAVLLRRRPPDGLLGGMAEVPGSVWGDRPPTTINGPLPLAWRRLATPVRHIFTHLELTLDIFTAPAPTDSAPPADCWWSSTEALAEEALPTLFRKVINAATLPEKPAAQTGQAAKSFTEL